MKKIVCAVICSISIMSHAMHRRYGHQRGFNPAGRLSGEIKNTVSSPTMRNAEEALQSITKMFEGYLNENGWTDENVRTCLRARGLYIANYRSPSDANGITMLRLPNTQLVKSTSDPFITSICGLGADNSLTLWKRNSDLSWVISETIRLPKAGLISHAMYLPPHSSSCGQSSSGSENLERIAVEIQNGRLFRHLEVYVKKANSKNDGYVWQKEDCVVPFEGEIRCSGFSPSARCCAVISAQHELFVYKRFGDAYKLIGEMPVSSSACSIISQDEDTFILRCQGDKYKEIALKDNRVQCTDKQVLEIKWRILDRILGGEIRSTVVNNSVHIDYPLAVIVKREMDSQAQKSVQTVPAAMVNSSNNNQKIEKDEKEGQSVTIEKPSSEAATASSSNDILTIVCEEVIADLMKKGQWSEKWNPAPINYEPKHWNAFMATGTLETLDE